MKDEIDEIFNGTVNNLFGKYGERTKDINGKPIKGWHKVKCVVPTVGCTVGKIYEVHGCMQVFPYNTIFVEKQYEWDRGIISYSPTDSKHFEVVIENKKEALK